MRAGVYRGPGEVAVAERALPDPGPGEVRLRITACGLCGTDLHLVHSPKPIIEPGSIMGHEMAGVVDELGAGVSGFEAGEPVVVEPLASCGDCDPCREGRDSICRSLELYGLRRPGGFADAVVVPAHRLYRVPGSLSPSLAALAEPFAVAVHGLRLSGVPGSAGIASAAGAAPVGAPAFRPASGAGAREGPPCARRLLVLGAGAIGLAVVAVAREWGLGHIAITARYPHQARLARQLGADEVIDAAEGGDLDGYDADLVVETVGGLSDTMTAAGIALAPGGTICVLGVFMGLLTLDPLVLLGKEARLQWSNCYSRRPGEADFGEAVRILASCGDVLTGLLTHEVPLEEIERAFEIAGDKRSGAVKVTVIP
ncbi:MAG: alcohol dehydrogenase catalytic domain-containing protein [Holophagales bacterium]|nr:alcohol dehydrogenase catalytic domain-containing protein [Holophagales bacterium]MYF95621.1 alcohol dehydrogenase catalytic domain-containing protein [Holophagales bacterium]